jgi:hypothetical protein
MNKKEFDIVIIGGGVAGVSIAEIFSRNKFNVCLIEKNPKLCQETSGSHHGWFHFGSLYSIFPGNKFLKEFLKNIKIVIKYYSHFKGMNLFIDKNGKLSLKEKDKQWIRDERINYVVASRNDKDFNLLKFDGIISYLRKIFFVLTWEIAIKRFVSRHNKFHKNNWNYDNSEEYITSSWLRNYGKINIKKTKIKETNLNPNTHFDIEGFDRPMNSVNIINDLVNSILSNKGKILTNSKVVKIDKGPLKKIFLENGNEIFSKIVVVSSGKFSSEMIGNKIRTKVMASPLLVAYPCLTEKNFVRMTPFIDKSINHLYHETDGKKYSLIGGGYFAKPNDKMEMDKVKNDLLKRASNTFPNLKKSKILKHYFSYKTEFTSNNRNYLYSINEVSENFYSIIPGKFTLSFSLAVNFYKKITKKEPSINKKINNSIKTEDYIDKMNHSKLIN